MHLSHWHIVIEPEWRKREEFYNVLIYMEFHIHAFVDIFECPSMYTLPNHTIGETLVEFKPRINKLILFLAPKKSSFFDIYPSQYCYTIHFMPISTEMQFNPLKWYVKSVWCFTLVCTIETLHNTFVKLWKSVIFSFDFPMPCEHLQRILLLY